MNRIVRSASLPVGLILVALALITYSVNNFWGWVSLSMLGAGVILVAIYFMLHFRETAGILGRRDAKYGTNAIISTLVILGIIVLVNFIFSKRNYRYDLTAAGLYSLSDQTVKILNNLKNDVNAYAFYKSTQSGRMKDLLKEYNYHSSRFNYEFIDPDERPELAREYNVTAYSTTVLVSGEKQEKVSTQEEQDLTNALVKVTREGSKVIYFSDGHGEKRMDSDEREGYSAIADMIKEQNYEVKKLFIAREDVFPQDCSVLIIPGPQNALFEAELDSINAYIDRGGAVLFMVDPDPAPGMNEFFDTWGITIGNDLVIDYSGVGRLFGTGPNMPLISTYASHPIVEDFQNVACFFINSRSVTPKDPSPSGISVQWLVRTTERSFGETKLLGNQAQFNEGEDIAGPVTLGVVVTKSVSVEQDTSAGADDSAPKSGTGKLIVFGDSDFAANGFMRMQGNGNLFMNAVNWLAEEADLVSIAPKEPGDRRLTMSAKQTKIMFYISVLGIPAIVIISGISVFYRRRRKN